MLFCAAACGPLIQSENWLSFCQISFVHAEQQGHSVASPNLHLSSAVNGNRYLPASNILEKYKIGKVIGDGNFAVVKECVERYVKHM